MAKQKPTPGITYTALLVLAHQALEDDVRRWEEALEKLPPEERHLDKICALQLRQMESIRTLYRIETGVDL